MTELYPKMFDVGNMHQRPSNTSLSLLSDENKHQVNCTPN